MVFLNKFFCNLLFEKIIAIVLLFFVLFNRVTVNHRAEDICQPKKEGKKGLYKTLTAEQ